jgi:peptidoglycan/LPS O-acetylase OafA/YrhL
MGETEVVGGRTRQRGDIQGLRAIAVLLVVLNHAEVSGLTGGFVGVDVFFVISGFLITGILVREIRRTGRISMMDFYARRARRILPAASVVLIVTVLVSGRLFNYLRADEVLTHSLWATFFAANIYSASQQVNYFAETSFVSPVQHFWSLAVEEQFYLVWPPIILLVLWRHRRTARHGRSGEAESARRLRRLVVTVLVLCAGSLAWSIWLTGTDPTAAYYSAPTRGWELGLGALLALWAPARVPASVRAAMSWAGLVAIGFAATGYSAATAFPGYHALLPTVGAALVLAGGSRYGAALVLDRLPLRWIGDISYSLYLWHLPALVLSAVYLDRDLRPAERGVVLLAATALSALSYLLVETPARRAEFLSRHRLKALVLWPATAVMVVATVAFAQLGYGPPATAGSADSAADLPADLPSDDASGKPVPRQLSLTETAAAAAELARRSAPLPRRLKPSLDELWEDVAVPPPGCSASDTRARTHQICLLGDPKASRTIVLLGDSHMSMWMDPIVRAATTRRYRVVSFMKGGCFPADVTLWRADEQRVYTECDDFRRWAYAEIAKLEPDRIIISGMISAYLADAASGQPVPIDRSQVALAAGMDSTLRRLRRLAPAVHVISSTTVLRREAGDCLAGRKATRATCAAPLISIVAERNELWRKTAGAIGAHWVDVNPWLCDGQTCPLVIGGVIAYRDTNHISRTFADRVGPELVRKLAL